jgi:sugar O-acyltransferase (sialic acid O-acetyltransferase NeuD family)
MLEIMNFRKAVIIGAGGYGRMLSHLDQYCCLQEFDFKVIGFLDDRIDLFVKPECYPPIIGSVENFFFDNSFVFICALGNVDARFAYSKRILDRGGVFFSFVHKSSVIKNCQIGTGVVIHEMVSIGDGVSIGDHSHIQAGSIIGHDAKIGSYVHLSPQVFVGGGAEIGDRSQIYAGSKIHPKVSIGLHSTVGMGAVVLSEVSSHTMVAGVPARVIRQAGK